MTDIRGREAKFFICTECGNLIEIIDHSGVTPVCCGKVMHRLDPDASTGKKETHMPWAEHKDETIHVEVGDCAHPMNVEHHIVWIALQTDSGLYRKEVTAQSKATADFKLVGNEKPVAVYAYCNIHGLYRSQL